MRRYAVGVAAHLRRVVHPVPEPDAVEPLLHGAADPAGNKQPRRESVRTRQRLAVHRERDQGVFVHRLGDGDSPREGLAPLGRGVVPVSRRIDRALLHPGRLQDVAQSHPRPLAAADRAADPLRPSDLRLEQAAAVAGALEDHLHGDLREREQVLERKGKLAPDFAVDAQRPAPQVLGPRAFRYAAVVAHEVARRRRYRIVEQMDREARR